MLHQVSYTINALSRIIVTRHLNSLNCEIHRKSVLRTSESVSGGLPTMGGLGVLSSDDEENFEYRFIGNAFCLRVGFERSSMMDRQDTHNDADEVTFLIEPESQPGSPNWFDIRKNDVLYTIEMGLVKKGFEIVDILAVHNIPPHSVVYVCNRRDDMDEAILPP